MADVDEREARNPFSGPRADLGRRAQTTDTIIIGVAVIAGLYFGREVLVPMSIAVLLSFLLVPVTDALGRLRIGRVASVLIAVALAFAILGILGAVIGRQAAELSENLPAYQVVISKKLDSVRSSAFGARMVEKAADALHGLENNIRKNATPQQPTQEQAAQAVDHPLLVEVHEPPPGACPDRAEHSLGPAAPTRDGSDRHHFCGLHPAPATRSARPIHRSHRLG